MAKERPNGKNLTQHNANDAAPHSWEVPQPAHKATCGLKPRFTSCKATSLFWKILKSLREHGIRYTWHTIQHRHAYRTLSASPLFTKEELNEQRQDSFPRKIKFSIVVPLYNTPEIFLQDMIRSVIDQTYDNWELCLADGSDPDHHTVGRICMEYAATDSRIHYQKLEKNLGISGNTNACLEMAVGDYIGLFDHDDVLHPAALHEVMRAICTQDADFIYTDEAKFYKTPADAFSPNFKPDFAPDTLRSNNYICHFTVFKRKLLEQTGPFCSAFDGSQDHDMILRLTENAQHIVHIPEILYYWRAHKNSVAENSSAKPYTQDASHRALAEHLQRLGLDGTVGDSASPNTYRISYKIIGTPKISIVIPNMDHIDTLKKCIRSILEKTTYPNYELIIVENNSTNAETFAYYDSLKKDDRIRIISWSGPFNYSAINNYGIQNAVSGEYILLLNNDTEVITPDWLQEMLMFAQRQDVGAVGAMLHYPNDTIQHAGVILGIGGMAGHSHKHFDRGESGFVYRANIAQNLSAVTGACMMIRRAVWDQVGGLDEQLSVSLNDVDLCMRIRKLGYLIVWTPYAELYHYESLSRGYEDTPEKKARYERERQVFQERWRSELDQGDPYYNPNLTLMYEDFSPDLPTVAKERVKHLWQLREMAPPDKTT